MIAFKLEHGFVTQDAEIGGSRIEKKLLFGAFEFCAAGERCLLGRFGFRLGAEAAKKRLLDMHAVTARRALVARIFKRCELRRVLIGPPDARRRIGARSPVAQGLRHVLVHRT